MQRNEMDTTHSDRQELTIQLGDETLAFNEALAIWLWLLEKEQDAVRAALQTQPTKLAAAQRSLRRVA